METVNSAFLRPLPPLEPAADDGKEFEVNDVVDAFWLDGWGGLVLLSKCQMQRLTLCSLTILLICLC